MNAAISMLFSLIIGMNIIYFKNGVGVLDEWPIDNIIVQNDVIKQRNTFFTPSELGLLLNVYMYDNKTDKIISLLKRINTLPHYKGLLCWYNNVYNFDINNNLTAKPYIEPLGIFSMEDNANFIASLMCLSGWALENNQKEIFNLSEVLINRSKEGFKDLYNPETQQLRGAYHAFSNSYSIYHVDRLYSESRIAAIIYGLFFNDIEIMKGLHISLTKDNVLKTVHGHLFQAIMPLLFFDEQKYSEYLFSQHIATVIAQIKYCKANNIPALVSPCAGITESYITIGIPELAEFPPNESPTVGSPHATALTALVCKELAYPLLFSLYKNYNIITAYGWYDSLDNKGRVTNRIIALDQGMLILSLQNTKMSYYMDVYLKHYNLIDRLNKIYSNINKGPEIHEYK